MRFLSRMFGLPPPGFDSAAYWRRRYRRGRTSGAGSYGRLAEYKAEVINALVRERAIASVVEFGCGDGNQASLFEIPDYLGVDVVPQVVQAGRRRFADRPGWRFATVAEYDADPAPRDMAMSLDVIYHLVEDGAYDSYMRRLVGGAARHVLIYSSDHDAPTGAKHVRHRAYSDWMRRHAPQFRAGEPMPHPYPYVEGADPDQTSFAFFRLYERAQDADAPAGGAA